MAREGEYGLLVMQEKSFMRIVWFLSFRIYKNSVMIWGGICGSNGGRVTPVVVWQKEGWGNINSQTYCEHVIRPVLYPFWYDESQEADMWLYVMEDGA